MKKTLKRILAAAAAALMLIALISCSKAPADPQAGDTGADPTRKPAVTPVPGSVVRVSITVDGRNAYQHPDLTDAVRRTLVNDGLLVTSASITARTGSNLRTVIESLSVFSIPVQFGPTTAAPISVGGIKNGFCGETGYWIIRVNGAEITSPAGEITVNDGDSIELIFTCSAGADLESPGTTVYTASPAAPTPDPNDTGSGKLTGDPTPEPTATPEPTPTPAPGGTSSPGDKTSGRH